MRSFSLCRLVPRSHEKTVSCHTAQWKKKCFNVVVTQFTSLASSVMHCRWYGPRIIVSNYTEYCIYEGNLGFIILYKLVIIFLFLENVWRFDRNNQIAIILLEKYWKNVSECVLKGCYVEFWAFTYATTDWNCSKCLFLHHVDGEFMNCSIYNALFLCSKQLS